MYDSDEFDAFAMCCSCEPIVYADGCENSEGDATDSYGDGCYWYDWYPEDCGWYDTDDFSAIDMCCSCVGATGPEEFYPEGCENTEGGATDEWGDGCGWYNFDPMSCGDYDTDEFNANEMCCMCQVEVEPYEGVCDESGQVDSYGDGCDWYDENPDGCGWYDTLWFQSNDMCCACVSDGTDEEWEEEDWDDEDWEDEDWEDATMMLK